jgi:hypothetical protein
VGVQQADRHLVGCRKGALSTAVHPRGDDRMRLKHVKWSTEAAAYYLRLLSAQRYAIDSLVRRLSESETPASEFRQVADHPDYWFTKTDSDLLMVVRQIADDYAVAAFVDWRQQYDLALEEAAAALASADAAQAA